MQNAPILAGDEYEVTFTLNVRQTVDNALLDLTLSSFMQLDTEAYYWTVENDFPRYMTEFNPAQREIKFHHNEGVYTISAVGKIRADATIFTNEAVTLHKEIGAVLIELDGPVGTDYDSISITARAENASHITVTLDFIDSLFVVVTRLGGPVDWKQLDRDLIQTETIIADRITVPSITATSFISLRYAAMKRLPYLIKQEVHDLLSNILEEAKKRSSSITPWFPSDFHSLFVQVSMDLWSLELQGLTGVKTQNDPENIQNTIDSLHRAVVSYTGLDTLVSFSIGEAEPAVLRALLYKWTGLLLEAPFSPDKE